MEEVVILLFRIDLFLILRFKLLQFFGVKRKGEDYSDKFSINLFWDL